MEAANTVWPTELVVNRAERVLKVTFDDGKSFSLPAEYLRTQSPSAEVQGHSESQRQTVGGKQMVAITGIEQVGGHQEGVVADRHRGAGDCPRGLPDAALERCQHRGPLYVGDDISMEIVVEPSGLQPRVPISSHRTR